MKKIQKNYISSLKKLLFYKEFNMKKENNIVAMVICAICKEPKGVAISRRLDKNIPKQFIDGPELCDKCLKKMKDLNRFIIYECEKNNKKDKMTGRWIEVNLDCLNKSVPFYDFVDKNRFIFAEPEEFNHFLEIGKKINEHKETI